jgi:CubicO group peptidase (beta-lactamase class C family)
MKKILLVIAVLVTGLGVFAQSFIKDSLDNYITQGMKDWDIPGMSVVIVKDGNVVYMKGFGVRDIESKSPVDNNTLFMIASNTKLFTGTALANLEHNKKLSLNDKITKFFPDYRLYDNNTSDLLTIRDLLSHRIGTKTFQGDFTYWNSTLSRKEIMKKMRLMKPVGPFRQGFGYCNSCFMTAGEIIPVVANQPWEKYVYDSIMVPVGMTGSYITSVGIGERANVSKPYTTAYTGVLTELPYDNWDNLGPAAAIVSNATDMSKWLLFQLDSGKVNGKQVLPWPVLRETRQINIPLFSRGNAPTHFMGYGLGLFMRDYYNRMLYYHSGGAGGMISEVAFMPEEKLGIAILTNNDNHYFLDALQNQIIDAYLGLPYVNKSQRALRGFKDEQNAQLTQIAQWEARVKAAKQLGAVRKYAGNYTNGLYGNMTIVAKNGMLYLRFGTHHNLTATLQYMDNDEWLLKYDNILYGIFSTKFKIENERVVSVEIKENEYVEEDPYTFVKQN